MNQAEKDEAQQWLQRLENQHNGLSADLKNHEKILSRYTISAIKNDINRLEMHINDIKETLGETHVR